MRRTYELDPIPLIIISIRQAFQRMYLLVRVSIWRLIFSLPIVTAPAATAAFYHTIREGLLDPHETHLNLRQSFPQAFKQHFWRSTGLYALNFAALIFVVQSIFFWLNQGNDLLVYITVISAYFLLMWWLCQPLLAPMLVENPDDSVWLLVKKIVRVVITNPLYAIVLAMIRSTLTLLTIALLGPVWLVLAPLAALITVQGLWAILGKEIPELAEQKEEDEEGGTAVFNFDLDKFKNK